MDFGCGHKKDNLDIRQKNGEKHLQTDFLQAMQLRKLDPAKTISVVLGHAGQSFTSVAAKALVSLVYRQKKIQT